MADVRSVELLVLRNAPSRDKEGCGIKLRVVQWIFKKKEGGEGSSVKFEKRSYFPGPDGDEHTGKAEGFGIDDFKLLKAVVDGETNFVRVMKLMENPPAIKPVAAPEPTADDSIEEVPF